MMQILPLTFMTLLLAHLVAVLLRQRGAVRKYSRIPAYVCNCVPQWVLVWACLLLFTSTDFLSWRSQIVLLVYALMYPLIDKLQWRPTAKGKDKNERSANLPGQTVHVLAIAAAALAIAWNPEQIAQVLASAMQARTHILEIAVVYLCVVFSGGHLIRYLTKHYRENLNEQNDANDDSQTELKNAGLYIGYLERFLIVTAIVIKSATLAGLILTGKSIARFPEMKKPSFAEYFLIGTLLSISLAVLGGLLLQQLLYGSISLK